MTKILADALVPIFVGLFLGYAAGLRGSMDNKHVKTLIAFVMSFAVPSSLFLSIVTAPRMALREQAPTALVLTIGYAVIYLASFLWALRGEQLGLSDSSVVALTVGFPNSAAVGLPLLASVFGMQSDVTVATSLAVGAITVSPITLAILEANRYGSARKFDLGQLAGSLARSLKRPLVWAPLLAVAVAFAGLNLPSYVNRSLAVMGSSADGAALVLTGLVVSAQKFELKGSILLAVFLKNAVQPAVVLGLGLLIHLPIQQIRYITLICAMPCGFFGAVFGKDFGSSPQIASSGLIASYAIGIGTLAAWVVFVNHLQ